MEIDAELLDAFIASCKEQLGDIERHVLSLEGGAAAEGHIGPIFRAAHSIKADAAAMGFERISEFSHAVEDVLELVRSGRIVISRQLVDALLGAFDVLRRMVNAPGGIAPDVAPGLMRLNKVLCSALTADASRTGDSQTCAAPQEAPGAGARDAFQAEAKIMHVTIPAGRLDSLVDQVGELAGLQARLTSFGLQDSSLAAVGEDMERLVDGLRDHVMSLRLVPLKPVFAKFRRLVRDVAATTGKQVEFLVSGEDTVLDKSAVERVQGPLAHIVRNAVDHGIESPERRVSGGKHPAGRVWMSARQIGGDVEITVRDDGRGIDRAALTVQARARGILREGVHGDDVSLTDLVCLPGLSSAEQVSSHSGRGVGMDAARDDILDMRGSLELISVPGQGTTVRIRIPLSLAMLDCLEVEVGGTRFFIQLPNVEECLEFRRGATATKDCRGVLDVRGGVLSFASLGGLFDIPEGAGSVACLVVLRTGEERFGLVVDAVVGHRQVVLKPLGRGLGRLEGLLGCTVGDDGRMALILDVLAVSRLCFRSGGTDGR